MRFKLLLFVAGVALLYVGYNEWRLASGAGDAPVRMTCAQLEASGPGANPYVSIGNFVLMQDAFVCKYRPSDPKYFVTCWLPAVAAGNATTQPAMRLPSGANGSPAAIRGRDIRVLVKSTQAHNTAEVAALSDRPRLEGVVVNRIESLTAEEKDLLAQSYPGLNFDKCWILEEGRKPLGTWRPMLFMVGGASALFFGVTSLLGRKS